MEKGAIGIFDSGLGGLLLLSRIRAVMPQYDYVFFGDQAYVPYGNKTKEELLVRAQKVFSTLFEDYNCKVIFLACNTTSTNIYTELKKWVHEKYPDRQIWSIVEPTVEAIDTGSPVVFFGTHRTISSHGYRDAMIVRGQNNVTEIEMPELATLIEQGKDTSGYISSFSVLEGAKDTTGVLVCTHYGIARDNFQKAFPYITRWVCQEDIMPSYIEKYLSDHPQWFDQLSTNGTLKLLVSAPNPTFNIFSKTWFGDQSVDIVTL